MAHWPSGDVAEGVVDVGELGGRAAGLDVLDVVVAAVDAPLGEVAEHLVAAAAVAGAAGGGAAPGRWPRTVVGGVTGLDGVRVGGAGAQAGVGVRGAGDRGDLTCAVAVDVVAGDAHVVGGRRSRTGETLLAVSR